MIQKYVIGAIYEKDGETPKESHQFRVGRTGKIDWLHKGQFMFFNYDFDTSKSLKTSPVEDYAEDDNGIWVYTEDSIYRFDSI